MQNNTEPADSALSLLLAAFEGVPRPGTRELRLSEPEVAQLRQRFPDAVFTPLERSGDKWWYAVTLG